MNNANSHTMRRIGVRQQIALVAGIRWRIQVNSLRSLRASFDFIAKILSLIWIVFLAFGGGVGMAAFGFFFGTSNDVAARYASVPFWVVFGVWFVLPLIIGALRAEFDFRNLLRYPLRYSSFFILSLAYGMFDAAAVVAMIWLAAFGLGLVIARPGIVLWVAPLWTAFAALCLFLSCVVYSWLARLLSTRRARERFFVLMLFAMLSVQFIGPLSRRWGGTLRPLFAALAPLVKLLPPNLAGAALKSSISSSPIDFLLPLAGLLALAAGLAWVLHRRLLAQFQGEDLSETQAIVLSSQEKREAAAAASASFAPSFLRDPVAALVEKDLRYLMRNTLALYNLCVPLLMVVFFRITFANASGPFGIFSQNSQFSFPAVVVYTMLIASAQALNAFAFEGYGINFLLGAPVRFRDVLLAKNITIAMIAAAELVVLLPLSALLFRLPSASVLLSSILIVLFALLVDCGVGNFLSVQFPRAFQFGSFRQKQSGMSALANMFVQFGLMGLTILVFWLSGRAGSYWWAAAIFALLCAIAFPAYLFLLDLSARLATERREILTAELCK